MEEQLGKNRREARTDSGIRILYEDNHLLVVEKPVNMPVQADSTGDQDLLTLLKDYVRTRYNKPGEAYLGLTHRLDRPVGGVMAFAKTSKAAARLSSQFRTNEAKKRYAAVVTGRPKRAEALTDWLYKGETTFTSRVVAPETPGSKEARLSYALLGEQEESALLDVTLYTGRPHQIRVQLSHAGLPILGDQRYDPNAVVGTQIALWAYALTLTHPTLHEQMTFFSAPQNPAFSRFPAQTALLPAFAVCRGVAVTDECIAVDKNAGVETEGALLGELQSLFGAVYPVHRLDANTEGIVLFARTEQAAEKFEALFYRHALKKIYHALVLGAPPETGRLVHYVRKDAAAAQVTLCNEGDPGALRCALNYRVIEYQGETSLVEIELMTGRTHQIRVQMAAVGHPVVGDDRYGDRDANKQLGCRRQALVSKRLEIDGHTYVSQREPSL